KGKGKQVEKPRIMYKGIDFTDVPFDSWPKPLQVEHDEAAAIKAQEEINLEDQQLAEKEAEGLKMYDEWDDEKIRIAADIELNKLIKIEENEVPNFNVQSWFSNFVSNKRKENAAARRKVKVFKGPTVKQQRKEYERYLKNMGGWTLVQLKAYSDKEVFDLYQQTKRRTDTFYNMGCAEDLEQIAQMNKKLVPEKIA
ncbi:MAG: hypothetical protein J6586_10880, partial [Snodgrassella sp.]|nr:hypothetical protein [Snodgrassella sp.]